MNEQCPTTSGSYRCKKQKGHKGDCEADDFASWRFGPYTDRYRGKAYLRGRLEMAAGTELDVIGEALAMKRTDGETDCAYRERMWRTA